MRSEVRGLKDKSEYSLRLSIQGVFLKVIFRKSRIRREI